MKGFYEQVYDIVEKIPVGKVLTYGDIAKMLGHPRGARLVGYAMGAACETDNRPWHRVTFDGKIDVEKYRWHPKDVSASMNLKDLPLKI